MTPLQLIKHFGSATAAAKSLGLTRQAVHGWKKRGRIPARTQAWIREQIALKTNGGKNA